jgi:hypothetical protein
VLASASAEHRHPPMRQRKRKRTSSTLGQQPGQSTVVAATSLKSTGRESEQVGASVVLGRSLWRAGDAGSVVSFEFGETKNKRPPTFLI